MQLSLLDIYLARKRDMSCCAGRLPRWYGRTTIFLVEQDVATAFDLATTGYVLENGRVVLSGPTAELRVNPHVKKAYLGL